jgi:hypothetical protein
MIEPARRIVGWICCYALALQVILASVAGVLALPALAGAEFVICLGPADGSSPAHMPAGHDCEQCLHCVTGPHLLAPTAVAAPTRARATPLATAPFAEKTASVTAHTRAPSARAPPLPA